MPETQLRQLAHEPFEYSQTPRADEDEWDQLVKFAMRKVSVVELFIGSGISGNQSRNKHILIDIKFLLPIFELTFFVISGRYTFSIIK